VPVGFAPVVDDSDVAITWDLPLDLGRALDVALRASPDGCRWSATTRAACWSDSAASAHWRGVAYCDDTRLRPAREDDPRGARRSGIE